MTRNGGLSVAVSRALHGFVASSAVILAAPHAHAAYRFCANINPVYVDSNIGEDNLKGLVTAAYHYMEVRAPNNTIYSGFADVQGCLNTDATIAGTYTHTIWPKVYHGNPAGGGNFTTVYPQEGSTLQGMIYTYSSLPAVTTTVEKRLNISGTPLDAEFRVSAIVEWAPDWVNGTQYKVYAEVPASADCVACQSGNSLYLSAEPSVPGRWVNQEKGVVAHELGHLFQKDLFGYFGQQGLSDSTKYCDAVTETTCKCTFVAASPGSGICGNEQWDRLHCLNSREYMFGAFPEGFGHFFATWLLNDTSQGSAIFPYYKALVNSSGSAATPPPVAHQVLPSTRYRWMETKCSGTMAGRGTEMDWLGFIYYLTTQTTNKYSLAEFQRVMTNASVCNGACTDSIKMTYTKLVQGVDNQTTWSAAKKDHFKTNGSVYGINH